MAKKRRNKTCLKRQNNDGLNKTSSAFSRDKNCEEISENDLKGMKRWIETLTFESFTDALEFTFHQDTCKSECQRCCENNRLVGNTNEGASPKNKISADSSGRAASFHSSGQKYIVSQDFDLLMEMISLQCPESISSMHLEGDEVDHCVEWRTFAKGRIESLCWFRWEDLDVKAKEQPSRRLDLTPSQPNNDNMKDINPIKLQMELKDPVRVKEENQILNPEKKSIKEKMELPSDLLDVLTQAGVKRSTSSLLETFNEVDELDEGTTLVVKNQSDNTNCTKYDHFNVEIHRWSRENQSSSLSSTFDQQSVDKELLLSTFFACDRGISLTQNCADFYLSSATSTRCRINPPEKTATNGTMKEMLIQTLRKASRGKFLNRSGVRRTPYCAPWFDPTKQWFSLPVYLSSRFEASLWDSYFKSQRNATNFEKEEVESLNHLLAGLSRDRIESVLTFAIGSTMKDVIQGNIHPLNRILQSQEGKQPPFADCIKNTVLWNIYLWNVTSCNTTDFYGLSGAKSLDMLACSSIVEWGTSRAKLKLLMANRIRDGLARNAEISLLKSISSEEILNFGVGGGGGVVAKTKKRKKKRIQKKASPRNASCDSAAVVANFMNEENQSDESDDSLVVERILSLASTSADFDSRGNNSAQNIAVFCETETVDKSEEDNSFHKVGASFGNCFERKGEAPTTTISVNKCDVSSTVGSSQQQNIDTSLPHNSAQSQKHRIMTRRDSLECCSLPSSEAKDRMPIKIPTRRKGHGRTGDLKRSKSSGDDAVIRRKVSSTVVGGAPESSQESLPKDPQSTHKRVSSSLDPNQFTPWGSSGCTPLLSQVSKGEVSIFDGAPLCLSGALENWNSVASQHHSETSIITDLLRKNHKLSSDDADPVTGTSSTAASIASSRGGMEDPGLDIDTDNIKPTDKDADGTDSIPSDTNKSVHFKDAKVQMHERVSPAMVEMPKPRLLRPPSSNIFEVNELLQHENPLSTSRTCPDSPTSIDRSLTPSAPPTPPPQLSPILVSLADLGKLREEAASGEYRLKVEEATKPSNSPGSVPSAPLLVSIPKPTLTPSWSRDDLRSIGERRKPHRRDKDDHFSMGHRQVDALLTYRNVVAQSAPRRPVSLHSYDGKKKKCDEARGMKSRSIASRTGTWAPGPEFPSLNSSVTSMPSCKEPIINKILHLDVACARSEGALESVDDASHCNVIPRVQADDTMTKDGATTISSVHSPAEAEQIATLREERNAYRDICLTLGAENAKLRNLLASKACSPIYHPPLFSQDTSQYPPYTYDFQFEPSYKVTFHNIARPIVAMSDAGAQRGDLDSLAISEDGTDMHPSVIGASENQSTIPMHARGDSTGRRPSITGTYAESDISMEHTNFFGQESHALSGFRHIHHQDSFFGPMPLHGMQSRLSKDISNFMQALKTQLKKNEHRREWAVEQITKTVTALWPRAQIKMYGSHVTKLCLPSSDVDFVICLPAVHKNAPAMAPGDLEGRNAINETNQKVLARKLKGESWLDQRSIKVIERTAVPVIKVSSKDSRSRVVQLDLSFDAKEHHGLEALDMIQNILEDTPMIRPLVLVLKQFLLDRGLLTAYTGGLSSYCLFLMVTRYCQEESPSWNDCGSLLMGLLDFYGNFFDPRTTGISVRTRQYFSRSQDAQHDLNNPAQHFIEAPTWTSPPQYQFPDLTRRNSFTDRNKMPRFQPLNRYLTFQNGYQPHISQQPPHHFPARSVHSGRPYTFDPIWVEDPLNPGNNVGRNAFRIFQVLVSLPRTNSFIRVYATFSADAFFNCKKESLLRRSQSTCCSTRMGYQFYTRFR